MLKSKYAIILSILVFTSIIIIISCGRKGILKQNADPHIVISEYSGIAKTDTTWSDSTMFEEIGSLIDPAIYDSLFYQEIFWRAWDVDGTVKAYAYRIGTWDTTTTPNEWVYDKAYGVEVDPETGWVLHLQPNGELDIWTPPDERFPRAKVFFPSSDTTDFRKNFGKFEVKCKDDRGAVSDPAAKYFVTYSEIPTTYVSTSQGDIDSCRVGAAILFEFNVVDEDPFGWGKEAAYYKYRLVYYEKIGDDSLTIDSIGAAIDITDWYLTEEYDIRDEVLLMANYPDGSPVDKPILRVNDINELTQIQVKAIDKADIEDPNYAKMTFFVRGHFTPETCPFMSSCHEWPSTYYDVILGDSRLNITPHIYILGEHSYLPYMSTTQEEIPSKIVSGETHYANRFYINKNEELSAIYSDDLVIHMEWHYLGEYQYVLDKQTTSFAGNTYNYDENLGIYEKYFCDIEYMDIQLDSTTAGLPPISTIIVSDEAGDWMRIPIYEDQRCKLLNLEIGQHIFKVRAVDFQGHIDPTPESLEFLLYERKGIDDKSGILLVDDTKETSIFAVEDSVDIFYERLLGDYSETVVTFDLNEDSLINIAVRNSECRNDELNVAPYFAPSDIQGYKIILWHANNPKEFFPSSLGAVHLVNHYDILRFYINGGGNLVFTGCAKIRDPGYTQTKFLQEYAGLADTLSALNTDDIIWGMPTVYNSPMGGASGSGSFKFIEIDSLNAVYSLVGYPFPQYFGPTLLGAIGSVTFLNIVDAEEIFTCIPGPNFPDPEPYDGASVGSKYTKTPEVSGSVYILGFPLFYFQVDQVKLFLNKVFDEVGISYGK